VIKFGFIGTGAISYHSAREIVSHPGAEIVAVSDHHQERLDAFADEFSIKNRYTDSKELIASDLDAIYIAVPNAFHAPLSEEALDYGKHVLLEKPFALNFHEARAVADAVDRSGKHFMVGMNQRFVPGAQKIKTLVQSGHLGEIYHAKALWLRRAGIPRMGTWFGSKALSGGGSLLDIGVHMLDLALYLMDNFKPEAVSGATYTRFGNRGIGEGGWGMSDREETDFDVDDFATAIIKLDGGATLSLDVSWAVHQSQGNEMNVNLFGTDAGASVYPPEIFRYGDGREYHIVQNPEADMVYPHTSRIHNFINAIEGTEAPCVTLEQSLAVQAIIDAIYQSCHTGKEVRLGQ
jgi:predicted dehydrogenase